MTRPDLTQRSLSRAAAGTGMSLIEATISRALVRLAILMIRLGWTIIHREERKVGLLPLSSLEPREPWL